MSEEEKVGREFDKTVRLVVGMFLLVSAVDWAASFI